MLIKLNEIAVPVLQCCVQILTQAPFSEGIRSFIDPNIHPIGPVDEFQADQWPIETGKSI